MQTFLPFSDFDKSAQCLDGKRLTKENLETRQILNTLCGFSEGWKSHPIVKAWAGHIRVLIYYGLAINAECIKRGFKNNEQEYLKYLDYCNEHNLVEIYPEWLKNELILQSHKNRLYCKGEIDIVCAAIKKALKIKSIDQWLKENYKKSKNQLKWNDCIVLKKFCEYKKIDITEKNWYSQFGWENINPAGEYIWPIS